MRCEPYLKLALSIMNPSVAAVINILRLIVVSNPLCVVFELGLGDILVVNQARPKAYTRHETALAYPNLEPRCRLYTREL